LSWAALLSSVFLFVVVQLALALALSVLLVMVFVAVENVYSVAKEASTGTWA
jgi:hypothetical protein